MADHDALDRLVGTSVRVLEGTIGAILAVMVVLVFGNVVLRYGFNSGIAVSEELSRYLFIWLTFIGAAVALHEHAHLGVDSLVRALPRRGRLVCAVAGDVLMLGIVAILIQGSWTQASINLATRSPVSEVPLALIYVAGLTAGVLMSVVLLRHLYRLLVTGARDEDLALTQDSEDLATLAQATPPVEVAPPGAGGRR